MSSLHPSLPSLVGCRRPPSSFLSVLFRVGIGGPYCCPAPLGSLFMGVVCDCLDLRPREFEFVASCPVSCRLRSHTPLASVLARPVRCRSITLFTPSTSDRPLAQPSRNCGLAGPLTSSGFQCCLPEPEAGSCNLGEGCPEMNASCLVDTPWGGVHPPMMSGYTADEAPASPSPSCGPGPTHPTAHTAWTSVPL